MFIETSNKFSTFFSNLKKKTSLIENLDILFIDLRNILLELDIPLIIIKDLFTSIKKQVSILESKQHELTANVIIKILQDSIYKILSKNYHKQLVLEDGLNIIAIYGSNGVGKTTTVSKLAYFLQHTLNKKVCCVSFDNIRHAAQSQLIKNCKDNDIRCVQIEIETPRDLEKSVKLINKNIQEHKIDVLIIDTPGANPNDHKVISYLKVIGQYFDIKHKLLVLESIIGSNSLDLLSKFDNLIKINGLIVSKIDIDHKGGVFFTSQYLSNKPIHFVTTGENILDIEKFNPKRIINIMFNIGDIEYLSTTLKQRVDKKELDSAFNKIINGGEMNYHDLLQQLKSINKIGSIAKVASLIPKFASIASKMDDDMSYFIKKQIAIISSMTFEERSIPDLTLEESRAIRIAKGSGTKIEDVYEIRKRLSLISKNFNQNAKSFLKNQKNTYA